jgi:probable rRNA maturation factor
MTIVINIQYATGSKDVPDRRKISKWVRLALAGIREAAVLTIRIVDAKEAAVLNKTWRGINKATNVLSFPAGDNPLMPELMGDIVICAPVISREAAEQDKTAHAHWAHMIIHGVLHLAGYDHTGKRDAKKMESLEIEKLESINFPNPYE